MQPLCDIIWRPGPEFSVSVCLLKKCDRKISVRDSWIKFNAQKYVLPLWGSWIDETIPSEQLLAKDSAKDSGQISKSPSGSSFVPEKIFDNLSVRDEKICSNTQDQESCRMLSEDKQLIEEPWLLYSSVSHNIPMDRLSSVISESKVPEPYEVHQLQLHKQQLQDEEMLLPENVDNQVSVGDPISTVILINSSRCTMQRIAVLEDDKLVELLLEPVKNNVQCDSIYLGVVTKLVPHMGGAFVNIGTSRPSLMDIKHNRLPFVFPPFCRTTNNVEVDFVFNPHTEHMSTDDVDLNDDLGEVDFRDVVQSDDIDIEEQKTMNDFFVQGAVKKTVNGNVIKYENDNESKCLNDPSNTWSKVQKGSKLIVQVVKEGLGTKSPILTAYPKLRSRFWILLTNCDRICVSKKISGADRSRLRIIAKKLQPRGFGLTVRSAAAGHSLEELQIDLERLLTTWKNIMEYAKYASLAADEGVEGAVPVMLHQAMGQVLSVVQDYFNENVKRMVVDSPRIYHEVTSYLQEIAPDLCGRVELYNKKIPLFDDFNIEEEINNTLNKRVSIANGGSLVIEQTEALVSIDVNGGHGMFGMSTSQEYAILDVNLAAAKQIARELRLRDIGGIIVVDFIDMEDDSSKRLVFDEMKKAVMRDRSLVNVYELSKHGLMEIIRKRVRPSVTFMISEPCSCCQATGRVEAVETSLSKIEHEICRLLAAIERKADPEIPNSWPRFILRVDHHMCSYLSSGRKSRLATLSSSLKVWILLKVARGFNRGAFEVKPFCEENTSEVPISLKRLGLTS